MTDTKLKPCPFCGAVAKIEDDDEIDGLLCSGCGFWWSFEGYFDDAAAQVTEAWNKRPIEDTLRAERDDARTLTNRALATLSKITEITSTTYDPTNPEATGQNALHVLIGMEMRDMAASARLRAMLSELEWLPSDRLDPVSFPNLKYCPICRMPNHHGHADGCRLATVLSTQ